MKIVEFEQQSTEWLNWRRGGIGASDAPIIMGESPWCTPHKLWERKLGLAPEQFKTPAMDRGVRLEPAARDLYMTETGNAVVPICVEHSEFPFLKASLDGMDMISRLLVEIKCPNEEAHNEAKAGRVPRHYWVQIQHQLMVTGFETADYYSYFEYQEQDGVRVEGVKLTVLADREYQAQLLEAELEFWQCIQDVQSPAGDQWAIAARNWLLADTLFSEAKATLENAEEQLTSLIPKGHKKQEGAGVSVSRSVREGSIDWLKILCDRGHKVDTEKLVRDYAKANSVVILEADETDKTKFNWFKGFADAGISIDLEGLVRFYAHLAGIELGTTESYGENVDWLKVLADAGKKMSIDALAEVYISEKDLQIVSPAGYRKKGSTSYRITALKDAATKSETAYVEALNRAATEPTADFNW